MRKFELSIDVNYVSNWGVAEAVRELFQNALDEEVVNDNNEAFFNYEPETETLIIGNKHSRLTTESLLLGVSSKSNNSDTVGQFGEGYKIATVVLLRTNHPITYYNYGNREVWRPRLVNSRRYNGRQVPTFFIDKSYPWTTTPNMDLTIVIENVTAEDYEAIEHMILRLNPPKKCLVVRKGNQVLLDPEYKGKVYVNGLFVCQDTELNYGYNIVPSDLRLERDRNSVANFDLIWCTSGIWAELTETEQFRNMLFSDNTRDIMYIASRFISRDKLDGLYNNKFGADTIPCSTQDAYDEIKVRGGTPVFVSATVEKLYHSKYVEFIANTEKSLDAKDALISWFNRLKAEIYINDDFKEEFENIVKRL